MATVAELEAEIIRLREACEKQDAEICQTLGKALGYPWYKDDQENFPGTTEEHGVCVGEHTAESIAMAAAERITKDATALRESIQTLDAASIYIEHLKEQIAALRVRLRVREGANNGHSH